MKIVILMLVACFAVQAQTAEGRMIVNGKQRELKYARAATLPDDMTKGNEMTRIFISEAPLPDKAIFDEIELMSLAHDGKIHGVQIDFHEDGVLWFLRNSDAKVSFSHSETPNPFPLKIVGGKAEGTMAASHKADDTVEVAYEISVKYSAPIEKYVPEPEPTAADTEAAKSSPAAKSYLDLVDAIAKGDRARIIAAAPPDKRADIDNEHFSQMLEMLQSLQPKDIRVLKAREKDGETTLWVTGKFPQGEQKGQITLRFEDKRWILRSERWRD